MPCGPNQPRIDTVWKRSEVAAQAGEKGFLERRWSKANASRVMSDGGNRRLMLDGAGKEGPDCLAAHTQDRARLLWQPKPGLSADLGQRRSQAVWKALGVSC
jgi:hypothetical protein